MERMRELSRKASAHAAACESRYHGCAQCTLAGIQEALGIQDDLLFRAATGLAAGGGLTTDGTCGAYTGAVMVMSSLFGRRRDRIDGDSDAKYRGFDLARRLHNRFLDHYGTLQCRAIHRQTMGREFDLWDPEQKTDFEDAGAHSTHCPAVCGQAAGWAVELLLREIERSGITLEDVRREYEAVRCGDRRAGTESGAPADEI